MVDALFLEIPKESPISTPTMKSTDGKPEKKFVFSPNVGDKTTTYCEKIYY